MNFFTYKEKLNQRVLRYTVKCRGDFKRMALKLIFWNFKCLWRSHEKSSFEDHKLHILLEPMGGLGDHIYFLKYYSCFLRSFSEDVVADILLPEEYKNVLPLYQMQENIRNVFFKTNKRYDVSIRVIRFPLVMSYDEKRLSAPRFAAIRDYIERLNRFYQENHLLYQSDFLGRHYSLLAGRTRENQADIENRLSMKDHDFSLRLNVDEAAILDKYHLRKDEFIVMQRGPGHHFKDEKNDVRQWPLEYYTELIRLIRQNYHQYQFVQLGAEYQEAIPGIGKNLLGETNIIEMLVLLKNAKLLIAQEGGLSVCRHFVSRKPSLILFGPTDANFFGFPENINLSADVCPGCEWLVPTWYEMCFRSGGNAKCMRDLTVEMSFRCVQKRAILHEGT